MWSRKALVNPSFCACGSMVTMSPWLEKRSVLASRSGLAASAAATSAGRTNGASVMGFPPFSMLLFNALGYVNKMTEELFKQEPYRAEAEGQVLACDARGIVLDRTIFYP